MKIFPLNTNDCWPSLQNSRRRRSQVSLLIRAAKKKFWEVKLSSNKPARKLYQNIIQLGSSNDHSYKSSLCSADELHNTHSLQTKTILFSFILTCKFCSRDPEESFSFLNEFQKAVHKSIYSIFFCKNRKFTRAKNVVRSKFLHI